MTPRQSTPRPAIEHRRHPRHPLRVPAIITTRQGEKYSPCWIVEACQEGLGVTCEGEHLPIAGFVEVVLPIKDRPEQAWPRCHAQVIHRSENQMGLWLGELQPVAPNPVTRHLLSRLDEEAHDLREPSQ